MPDQGYSYPEATKFLDAGQNVLRLWVNQLKPAGSRSIVAMFMSEGVDVGCSQSEAYEGAGLDQQAAPPL